MQRGNLGSGLTHNGNVLEKHGKANMKKRDWVAAIACFWVCLTFLDGGMPDTLSHYFVKAGLDFGADKLEPVLWFFGAVWFLIAVDYLREKE